MSQQAERRQYYRVDDNVLMNYSVIAKNEPVSISLEEKKKFDRAFNLVDAFNELNQHMHGALNRINDKLPDVATFLRGLDSKVQLLAEALLFQDRHSTFEPKKHINLGAGGMAFGCDVRLEKDTELRIDMILSPDLVALSLTAMVVDSVIQTEGDFPYRVSVGFLKITEQQSDQIIRHVTRVQSEQIRAARE